MRSSKEGPSFPYTERSICYFEVSSCGVVMQVPCNRSSMAEAFQRVKEGQTTLYAVWPGKYRSDLFIIDDMKALSDAFGIEYNEQHRHVIDCSLSQFDDGKSTYAEAEIEFQCGCELNMNNIKGIANDLNKQYGLKMVTTRGIGRCCSHGKTIYHVRILRSSLGGSPKR